MLFWLGTHKTFHMERTRAPLMVSARTLRVRRSLPRALGPWVLDSGGFSELKLFGGWRTDAAQYVGEVRRWRDAIPRMQWAAQQDWMCEPFMTERTGLTVAEHQRRTVANFEELRRRAPEVAWLPVLQGWTRDDYLRHVQMFAAAGIDLAAAPLVGLGSVCRRQATGEVENLIRELHGAGLKLHGFGFKLRGLARCHRWLASADSMAWSFAARCTPPLPGCTHKTCANCLKFALRWRKKVLTLIGE